MSHDDLLTRMLQAIDAPSAKFHQYDKYYAGEQALAFLSMDAKANLGSQLARLSINVPRLLVDSVAERLRVSGFDGADVWPSWLENDLDQLSGVVHRDALVLGRSYAICWANEDGSPNVSIESAHQVSTLRDPGTRRVVAAAKRWSTDRTTEATLFEPHQVTRLRANQSGATTAGFKTVEILDNPLGWVPVIEFGNRARILGDPRSEMEDVLDLTDALTKLAIDMMVGSEYAARPRRWATGLELSEDDEGNPVNPIGETDKLMVNEDPSGRFGQLDATDLAAYDTAITTVMKQISAVSGLPQHMLGIGADAITSADSIRASEAALTARAEARQQTFGRSWEDVARLMVAVRDGADPERVDVKVKWSDPSTRSAAQEADAVVKLHQAGLLPVTYALTKLGYTDDEIVEIRRAARLEAADQRVTQGPTVNV